MLCMFRVRDEIRSSYVGVFFLKRGHHHIRIPLSQLECSEFLEPLKPFGILLSRQLATGSQVELVIKLFNPR